MTLLFCRILYTVASQGSFLKAAEVLNLTPSAVSHSVSTMEGELGFQVFNRNKTGVTLTSYGEEIYPMVVEMLRSEEKMQQVVDGLNGLKKGRVRLGAFNSVCVQWLPRLMKTFREKYPYIVVEVYEGSYDDVIRWLVNGIVEIGFLSASCGSDFQLTPLYEDPLVCIAPKSFRTKKPGVITLDEMKIHPFVLQRESCDADVKQYLTDHKVDIHSSCHVVDDLSIAAMVRSGLGISIMPELTSRALADDLQILKLEPAATRTIGLAIPNKKSLTPAAAELSKLIKEL